MSDTVRREGWDLSAKVDYSQIKTANQLTDEWLKTLEKIDSRLGQTKLPASATAGLNRAQSATEQNSKAVSEWQQKLNNAGTAGTKTANAVFSKMEKTASATNKASSEAKELNNAYSDAGRASEAASKKETDSLKRVSETATQTVDKIKATGIAASNTAKTSAENLSKHYGQAFGKIKSAIKMVGAGISAGAIAAAVGTGAKAASSLQQQYTEITNLAVNGGEKQAEVTRNVTAMQAQGREMSIKYGKSQQSIAEGYEDLVKRGYTTGQALSALRSELQASVASGDSLADVYSVTSKVIEGFGLRSTNTGKMLANTTKTVNELAYAADMTSTGFSDLGEGMSYSASIAKQAHISMAETAAALGVLSNNGLESTRAGTGLRKVILSIQSDAAKISQKKGVLYSLGLKTEDVERSNGSLRSLSTIMGRIQSAVERTYPKNKTQQANVFKSLFGTEGVNAAEILAENAKEVNSLADATERAGKKGSYVQTLANKNSQTAQMQAKRAKQALNAFTTTIGADTLPAINKAGNSLAKFLTTKDGEKFQKQVGDVVGKFANNLVAFIEWLPNHQQEVKTFGITLASLWATGKIVSFINELDKAKRSISDLKNVWNGLNDGSLFSGGPTVKTATQTVEENAATATAESAEKTATNTAVEGATQAVTAGAAASGGFKGFLSKAVPWTGVVLNAVDVAGSMANAIRTGSKSARVTSASKAAGAGIGAGIGFAIGGPLGASVGASVGNTVGSTKFAQKVVKTYDDSISKQAKSGYITTADGNIVKLQNTGKRNKSGLSKSERSKASKLGSQLQNVETAKLKMRVALDNSSVSKAKKQLQGLYASLYKESNRSVKKRKSDEASAAKYMYSSGLITKKQYESMLKSVAKSAESTLASNKRNYQGLVSDTTKESKARLKIYQSTNKQISALEKNRAKVTAQISAKEAKGDSQGLKKLKKQRAQYNRDIERAEKKQKKDLKKITQQYASDERSRTHKLTNNLVKSWSTGGDKELAKYRKVINSKKKLSASQARKLVDDSEKTTSRTIASAEKKKNATVKSANQEYKQTVSKLKALKDDGHTITTAQYQTAKDYAEKERDSKVKAAEDAADKVEKQAKRQHKAVKKYAEKEAGDYRTPWQKTIGWFNKAFSGISQTAKNVWKWLNTARGPENGYSLSAGTGSGHHKTVRNHLKKSTKATGAIEAHASGGAITAGHAALVGEAGPELAYRVGGSSARILGANGPEVTKVHAGEHILNAHDTSKVLSGGLGHGTVLRGYSNGTDTLKKTAQTAKKAVQTAVKGSQKASKDTIKAYKTLNSKSFDEIADLRKSSKSTWADIFAETNKQTSKTQKESISDYTTAKKGILKQMDAIQDGVTSSAKTTASNFGNALDKMQKYAKGAMKDTVDQLNNGIRSIDKVLSQFGGNSQVIKPVHFARGTQNGHLTHNTLAMVNDATSGPRQEAIVRDGSVYIPRGKNTVLPLQKGDQVLNGAQTQELAHSWGLEHFAKGTGVSKSQLRKIAKQGDAHPAQAFSKDFSVNVKVQGADIQKGTTQLAKNSAKEYGTKWMKAIWDVIEEKIGSGAGRGGTREAFEKYAESHFAGKPYRMGASGPTYYDCSGMVAAALAHYGINIGRNTVAMQESAGVTSLGKNLSKTTTGDLVIFGHGTGANGHVGIVKNPSTGTMFNETPPSARVSRISDDTSMGYGYYRVNGLRDAKKSTQKTDNRLRALAKKELGPTALKWISKNLSEEIASAGSANLTGDQSSKIRELARLLKKADPSASKNGIAAIIGNAMTESGLNSSIQNGIGASGLWQFLGSRFAGLKSYAKHTIQTRPIFKIALIPKLLRAPTMGTSLTYRIR